jgi:uncharacterized membrane protein YeaQ/YmgE (transglycosylase-associated protein family)
VDLLQLLILLVIAGICAAIAQWIVGFSPGNLLVSIIIGVIGAYIGTWIATLLRLPSLLPMPVGKSGFDLVWAIGGSFLLLVLLYTLRGGGRRKLFGRG